MTAATTPLAPVTPGRPAPGLRRSADAAVLRLASRLVRRSALVLAVAVAAYVAIEALTYVATYPDAASRSQIASLQDNAAVRMLEGIPRSVDTVGGFVVWDGGWVVALVLALWASLRTVRLLRGDEDDGRAELVLSGPVAAPRALVLQLSVVVAVLVLAGAAAAVTLAVCGAGLAGGATLGLGLAGLSSTFAGSAAVAAQVLGVRRRAAGAAAGVVGLAFLVRMAANSSAGTGWLHWLTPFGWLDELRPYAGPRWVAVVPLVLAPPLLVAVAARLRAGRDLGSALVEGRGRRAPHLGLLGSPLAFAWRDTRGVLLAWLVGLGAYALLIGALLTTVSDFMARDPSYQRVLADLGIDRSDVQAGYLGVMALMMGLVVVLYTCWRLGAAAAEEGSGRLEQVLSRPVPKWRWFAGHLALTLAGAVALLLSSGLMTWLGARLTGADVTVGDALSAAVNPLPVVVCWTAVAGLTFAFAPRLTVPLPAAFAVVSLLVEMMGPGLGWPAAVLDLSAFHHLAYVPAEPVAVLPAAVLIALGTAGMVAAVVAFTGRDLEGA